MQARKEEVEIDEAEIEAYANNSTLVDPMIDEQLSSDEDEGEEEQEGEEDDGVEEFDGEDEEKAIPAAGPSRSRSLYKAPTLAELDELREAESSGGTTFSLQLDTLLSSTLLSSTPAPALKTLLGAVHDLVHGIPSLPAVSPREADERLGKGKIPFPGPKRLSPLSGEPKWTLDFTAPGEVFVAGSWAVCGGYKRAKGVAGNIDLVVVMPEVRLSDDAKLMPRTCSLPKTAQLTDTFTSALTTLLSSPRHCVRRLPRRDPFAASP